MATNSYFQSGRTIGRASEQNLQEDLIIECLKIYGFDVYYVPRKQVNEDIILGEDPLNSFEHAYPLEMYLENTSGFGGEGELLAKFGVEVRESANFVVARKRWTEAVGRTGNTVLENRPAEGDLLYFPLTKSFFEIRKVEGRTPFYQLGKLYTFTLQCELYQFSNERVDTGITEIDSIIDSLDKDMLAYEILLETGDTLLLEEYSDSPLIQESYSIQNVDPLADNVDFTYGINDILDFSEKNPFGEVVR
jgi:hypothetical protein